jgi:hypothetical protein
MVNKLIVSKIVMKICNRMESINQIKRMMQIVNVIVRYFKEFDFVNVYFESVNEILRKFFYIHFSHFYT